MRLLPPDIIIILTPNEPTAPSPGRRRQARRPAAAVWVWASSRTHSGSGVVAAAAVLRYRHPCYSARVCAHVRARVRRSHARHAMPSLLPCPRRRLRCRNLSRKASSSLTRMNRR